jgi:MoaA/NifB/PqqE/SkfB family radical SAM enzyme
MTTLTSTTTDVRPAPAFSFLWLELTGRCGLACFHCYSSSGPSGSHGAMTAGDWRSVITQAAGLGVSMVQFIGEPTLHPDFPALLTCAIDAGLAAEVYSNLTHVKDSWWDLLTCPSVSLATSYYSDDPAEHDAITGRPGSHARTLASIRQAIARGIPLRAGIVEVRQGQRTAQAHAELEALGVRRIRTDRLRHLGRAASAVPHDASELCGNCGQGIAAILPSGDVTPCVMARWLTAGNVRHTPLSDILSGPAMTAATAAVSARSGGCPPDHCGPDTDSDTCGPQGGKPSHARSAARSDPCAPDSDSDICQPPAASALAGYRGGSA